MVRAPVLRARSDETAVARHGAFVVKTGSAMGKVNYGRVIAGALLAGSVYFVADAIIHGAFLGGEHMAAIVAAGKPLRHNPSSYAYFAAFDLGKGLVAVLVYAAARPRFGPGVRTAIWAGLLAWFATEALPQIAAMPLP